MKTIKRLRRAVKDYLEVKKEEREIAKEVRDIHSDEEFQKRYGCTNEEMAAFRAAWYQVFLPFEILMLIIKTAAVIGVILGINALLLRALL